MLRREIDETAKRERLPEKLMRPKTQGDMAPCTPDVLHSRIS